MDLSRTSRKLPVSRFVITTTVGLALLAIPRDFLADLVGLYLLNVVCTLFVFVHGLIVLRIMWKLEKVDGQGTIPFAVCFFGIQHLAFGFGGVLVALFNENFYYANDQGAFSWSDAIIPFASVQFVAMTVGLLGVWIGVLSGKNSRALPGFLLSNHSLSWNSSKGLCLISLAAHGMLWAVTLSGLAAGPVLYLVDSFRPCADATFLLWGLSWEDCKRKWTLFTYLAVFGVLHMIRGGRGNFLFPVLFLAIGVFISPVGRRWNLWTFLKLVPLALILMWAIVKTEDLRSIFTRGKLEGTADAITRLESLGGMATGVNESGAGRADGLGQAMNPLFRIGGRLFEVSAADIITRTPSVMPFRGWDDDDWAVLLRGIAPQMPSLNQSYVADAKSGVYFLREYGWWEDPFAQLREEAVSYPVTILADSWCRFGWSGPVLTFMVIGFILARFTRALRFDSTRLFLAFFASALLVQLASEYVQDIITTAGTFPRRIVVIGVYTLSLWGAAELLGANSRRARQQPRFAMTGTSPLP
jgi:hypothetical protein